MRKSRIWSAKLFLILAASSLQLTSSAADSGVVPGAGGADAKKIAVVDAAKEPELTVVRQLQGELHSALEKSALAARLKPERITVAPLLWQAYIWLDYELCEEALVLCQMTSRSGDLTTLLIKSSRAPYTRGRYSWRIEWEASVAFDGTKQYDWEIVDLKKITGQGWILGWCHERVMFEHLKELGNPLLQRWIFAEGWKNALGREFTKTELQVLLSSAVPEKIIKDDGK